MLEPIVLTPHERNFLRALNMKYEVASSNLVKAQKDVQEADALRQALGNAILERVTGDASHPYQLSEDGSQFVPIPQPTKE